MVYDILDKARYPSAASTRYQTYASYLNSKKVSNSPTIEAYASRYTEKPTLLSTYSKYDSPKASSSSYEPVRYDSKYDSPKASSSSYEPVRYELKNSEPGYGDASAVSLLSTGYGSGGSRASSYGSGNSGAVSIAYPPPPSRSAASQQSQVPRLRAIEYDDNQKAALADFASALENFELKSIKNEDVYDIPAINPSSGSSSSGSYGSSSYTSPARLVVAKKQEAVRQAVDRGNDGYGKSQSQSYDSQPASSYDDRSYDRPSSGYGQAASAGDYASAASSGDSYRSPVTVVDKYQSSAAVESDRYRPVAVESERYRQAERAVDSYRPADNYRAADSYRAADNYRQADSYRATDSYRAADNYRAAAADPYRTVERNVESNRAQEESAYDNQDAYVTRQPASYGSGNSDYYESASNRQVEPSDPNCPYEDKYGSAPSAAPTSAYGSTSKLAAALSSVSVAKESASSAYDRVPSSGTEQDGYAPADELDPSKLDLKIVHLPVSVLKRLVGSGELALPSFQKKKK